MWRKALKFNLKGLEPPIAGFYKNILSLYLFCLYLKNQNKDIIFFAISKKKRTLGETRYSGLDSSSQRNNTGGTLY